MNWTGKNVLVTGACGFIGSHLAERLVELGARVRAMVLYHPLNSWGWIDYVSNNVRNAIEVIPSDIRSYGNVHETMKGMDFVFHLAALIGIPYSYRSPESYVDVNVKGTLNVLEAARSLDTQRVFITSTSEVYGTAQYVPIDEKHPLQGQSPYSATKIAADKIAESYHRSFGIPVTTVRPFNTYGPRQSARAVIPTIITQFLSGKTTIRLGSTNPTRDFNYVLDVVEAFIKIAESEHTIGEEINIASQREISIGELVEKIMANYDSKHMLIVDEGRVRPENSEVERLLGSNEHIKKLTTWEPKYSLEMGISKTIKWFSEGANFDRYKPEIYNV